MCERDDVGAGGTMTLKQWQKTDDFPFNTPLSSGLFQVVAGVEMMALPCTPFPHTGHGLPLPSIELERKDTLRRDGDDLRHRLWLFFPPHKKSIIIITWFVQRFCEEWEPEIKRYVKKEVSINRNSASFSLASTCLPNKELANSIKGAISLRTQGDVKLSLPVKPVTSFHSNYSFWSQGPFS